MEYELLFAKSVYGELKDKVKGMVFCKVINDVLVVKIKTKEEGLNYEYYLRDFARKLMLGLSYQDVAYEVSKEYKHYVLTRFFKY